MKWKSLAAIILFLSLGNSQGYENQSEIEIAIAPFLPVKTHVINYAPLRSYLEKQLQIPVSIISAPDYSTYFNNIKKKKYQLIITFAGSAWLAWHDSGYQPMLQPKALTYPTLVTRQDRTDLNLKNLKGKTIAMADEINTTSIEGKKSLQEIGYKPSDLTLLHLANQSTPINYVLNGEADAAIVSNRSITQLPHETEKKLRIVHTWDKKGVPGIIYLAHPDWPAERVQKASQLILNFANNTEQGKKMMTDMGYQGLAKISPAEINRLEYLGILLQDILATRKK